jgi:threonyl-tRNA synthetase
VLCRPFWLSPRQVLVVPVGQSFNAYAKSVADRLYKAGFFADVEDSSKTMNKKVREGQLAQYNFIFVVGAAEEVSRHRHDTVHR